MKLPTDFVSTYGPWAVITGASSGIGLQFAHCLAEAGLNVALAAPQEPLLTPIADRIRRTTDVKAKVIVCDFSKPDGWRNVVNAMEGLQVNLLINNAGISTMGAFLNTPINTYLAMLAINNAAVVALAHAFAPQMVSRGHGGIIFTSSVSRRMVPWVATYSATKSFVSSLATLLRFELQPKGLNILCLEPARVQTRMSKNGSPTAVSWIWGMGGRMMTPRECVEESLEAFATRAPRCTPGWGYKLVIFALDHLPTSFRLWLEDLDLRRSMKPALLTF